MTHTSSRIVAGLLTAAFLAGCSNANQSNRVVLPQQFRLPQSQIGTLFEQKSGLIAIARSDGNVVVMDQTGKAPVELTRDAGASVLKDRSGAVVAQYVLPMWSPDASTLALLETRSSYPLTLATTLEGGLTVFGQIDPQSTIREQTVLGTTSREISETERFTYEPGRITLEYGGGHFSSALYTVSPSGKGALKEVLYSETPVDFVDWSPTGDQLGVLGRDQEGQTLMLMSPDGADKQPVAKGAFLRWNWHPDGSMLLTQSRPALDSARLDIHVQATDNGETLAEVDTPGGVAATATQFSPDGNSMIIVQSGKDDAYDMVLADRDGKAVRTLTTVSGLVSYAWAPAGNQVAFVVRDTPGSLGGVLRVLDIDSGETRLLSTVPVAGFFWSPDGKQIATFSPVDFSQFDPNTAVPSDISEQSANPMLVQTIDAAAGPASARPLLYIDPSERFMQFLPQSDRFSRSFTIWSPNSRHLVVPFRASVSQGTTVDYVAECEASGSIYPRILGEGSLAVWSPR